MPQTNSIRKAGRIVRSGGVIAYPTEGVFGLGCLPDDEQAVLRILEIKGRDAAMGLIVIAAIPEQLRRWIALPAASALTETGARNAVTYVVPAANDVPYWIRGQHEGIAVRITKHPVAAALCKAADSALVSTSANISGRRPARNIFLLRRTLGHLVDYVVPGECGPAAAPSEMRDLVSGKILRPAS